MSLAMLRDPDGRDPMIEHLCEQGIETRPLFWPVHHMPPYAGGATAYLPVTEDASRRGVMLPSHTKLTDEDLTVICGAIASGLADQISSRLSCAKP